MSADCLIPADLSTNADGAIVPRTWRQPRVVTTFEHDDVFIRVPSSGIADSILYTFGSSSVGAHDGSGYPVLNAETLFTNVTPYPVSVGLRVTRGPTIVKSSSPHDIEVVVGAYYGAIPVVNSYLDMAYIDGAGGGVDAGSSGGTRYFANQETFTAARTVYGVTALIHPGESFRRFAAMFVSYSNQAVPQGAGEVNEVNIGSLREDLVIAPVI